MKANPKYFRPILHLFAFSSIAITQPILDMIGRNPEFLIAQQTNAREITLVLCLLLLVIPFALSVPFLLAKFISPKISRAAFSVSMGLLVAILALMFFKARFPLSDLFLLLFSIFTASGFLLLYWRQEAVRLFSSYISVAIVLVPLLFVLNESVLRTVFITADPTERVEVAADTPVVFVVLDELPLISLLDESLDIDAGRFPNFSRLESGSHWFRNTHTVSSVTTMATPAILSGNLRTNALPVAADHPQNLFTVLGASHDLFSWEIVTRLCASAKCNAESSTQNEPSVRGLVSDLTIVYLHLLSPPTFSQRLPVISQSWSNFGNDAESLLPLSFNEFAVTERANSRVEEFRDFVATIQARPEPALYFHHALLPHMPWEIAPSGKQYSLLGSRVPGLDEIEDQWSENDLLVQQAYQRHLMQTLFVDNLIGELLDRMIEQGIYDESLLVVTSDHGATFQSGSVRRNNTGEFNKYEVEMVPLFIKLPGQQLGEIHEEVVSTVDIFPTVASALNIPLNLATQGVDLFGNQQRSSIPQLMEGTLERDNPSLALKLARFGEGDVDSLYRLGPAPEFLGQSTESLNIGATSDTSFELDQQAYLQQVNPDSVFLPSWLTGELRDVNFLAESINLLVALNGTIVASTESYFEAGSHRFSVFVPESAITPGFNSIELFLVGSSDSAGTSIERVQSAVGRIFSYVNPADPDETQITEQGGVVLNFSNNLVRGEVDVLKQANGLVAIDAWAITENLQRPMDYLLMDTGNGLNYLGAPNIDRPDIVNLTENQSTLLSGWRFSIPGSDQSENSQIALKLVAVFGENYAVLKELNYVGSNSRRFRIANGVISTDRNEELLVRSEALGSIDLARTRNGMIDLEGWSSNEVGSVPPDYYLLDNGGELYFLGESKVVRDDLVEVFNEAGLSDAGFAFRLPLDLLEEPIHTDLRLLAVSGTLAIPVGTTSALAQRVQQQ